MENLLGHALRRDPEFALAYAQRARLHTLMFVASYDTGEGIQRRIVEDLQAAQRLAPDDPIVLAANGYYLFSSGDTERALGTIQSAEAAGLSEAEWLIPKTRLLLKLSRVEEAVRTHERMLSLDPGNPLVLGFTVEHLLLVHRVADALRVARLGAKQFPELGSYYQGYARFTATGETRDWRAAVEPFIRGSSPTAPIQDPVALGDAFQLLRFEHRYAELKSALRRAPATAVRVTGEGTAIFFDSVGQRPVAEYRGWTELLLNDRAQARAEGRAVLAFVSHQPETRSNRFFLRLLAAEGYTFTGQEAEAISAARSAMALVERARDAVTWVGVAALSARVYAWSGAQDEAVALLDDLATAAPGLEPALIARDPLYTLPLANNPRFQALITRLEADMRKTRL